MIRNPIVEEKAPTNAADIRRNFWEHAKQHNKVENYEEREVFKLTQEEADKCRYVMGNKNLRMAECIVHREGFSHGIRLHPPHLYNLKDGIVYYKKDGKWVRWQPKIIENLSRLT